jgi:chromosome segregation ATPase
MSLPHRNGGILVEFEPMSPDEIERTVQFLLRQQAQFEANIAKVSADLASLAARQAHFQTNLERLDATVETLSAKTDNIADGVIGLTGIVGQLINKVDRVVDAFERHLRVDHGYLPS